VRVLVTGGAGFIGRHACDALTAAGHSPLVLDRLRARECDHDLILGDIRDAAAVTEAVAHCEGVIHLAGVLGTAETIANPRPAAEVNILGGLNVLEACAQYGVPLVNIAVGNWFEYSTYSVTKSAVERFAGMYRRYRDLPVASVRAFNAYGPGQSVAAPYGTSRVRKIIPSFIMRALHGGAVEVYGDGSQVMDMVYVTDVAGALVAALDGVAAGNVPDEPLEAGTGRATTVAEIAALACAEVSRQTGITARVTFLPMRPGETPGSVVLAKTGLPGAVPLEEGLDLTVEHYRELAGC
jgi:UDP-glucose 4-epimerase